MLMSKSRLEKFLYALYSLDSSDLPTPLSRIEELYKCLVTGEEAPTFKPLSRVEKYLMGILGGYDVDSLPNPLSRVEVLLYKLATGDDNLDDIDSFLSEHEELLAEIIRNGGVGGNIDIEYISYTLSTESNTLYNTAEKPVKSAILKGQTLVNFHRPTSKDENRIVDEERWQTLTVRSSDYNTWSTQECVGYKPNTKYFAIIEVVENTLTTLFYGLTGSTNSTMFEGNVETLNFEPGETGVKRGMFTSRADFTNVTRGARSSTETNGTVGTHIKFRIMIVEYQEGMEYWDIPFFEGIKSVKMPVLTTSNEDGTKTNILTTSEEVELRGVGDMKDELNLLTGELTQHIGKVVLNGSESWNKWFHSGNTYRFHVNVSNLSTEIALVVCDKMSSLGVTNKENIYISSGRINVIFDNSTGILPDDTVSSFKSWLSTNVLTVVYPMVQPTVKTVDLSVVDQDGNNTKLSTFNDITHVTLSSEALIPEAELEVATKNEEDLEDTSVYTTHTIGEGFNTLYNTAKKPVKSAILKGSTKYLDIDTGDILDAFDESKNLELVSVKMPVLTTTGKNLFDVNKGFTRVWQCSYTIGSDGSITIKPTSTSGVSYIATETIELEVGKTYRLTWNETGNTRTSYMWLEGTTNGGVYNINKPFTVQEGKNRVTLAMYVDNTSLNNTVTFKPLLEQGTSATTYEPFKTNILTVNEEVELRGIGDVKDELNLLTGELTQRIGKMVIDGREEFDWGTNWSSSGTAYPLANPTILDNYNFKKDKNLICEQVSILNAWNYDDRVGISPDVNRRGLVLVVPNELTGGPNNVNGLRAWLNENPLTLFYEFITDTVKTVDLSVVDQDGNNTKLSTFNDITHVTLSSEGLIPEAELEVAEKVPEVAANMLTISREQEVIDTTVNEQSENVDSTMIATTEIYEELL